MNSVFEPACGTPGCFGGLISIVANDIPELKNNYTFPTYSYAEWAYTLRDFLGDLWLRWVLMFITFIFKSNPVVECFTQMNDNHIVS
jgi:hypothetical protein